MTDGSIDLISAGHICLDLTPRFPNVGTDRPFEKLLRPGSLSIVGPATISTGGGAANVGLSALRLGFRVAMMGKCGDDLLGGALLEVLRRFSPAAAEGMRVAPGEHTSYTVVLAVPGADRLFLHCPGANDTFAAEDIDVDLVARAKVFYFGYPPLMARMYADDGRELADIFRTVKHRGVTTALDMAVPDPHSPAGRADWPAILTAVLPHVDLFVPSVEELTFMLRRERFDEMSAHGDILDQLSAELLRDLSGACLDLGAAAVVIKCGRHGLYARGGPAGRIRAMGSAAPADASAWADRELFAPSFVVDHVVSATGAGDSAVAGFLGAVIRGLDLSTAADCACAVGAQNVTAMDTTSGVRTWTETLAMLSAPRVPVVVDLR